MEAHKDNICENWLGSSGHVNTGCGVVLRGRTIIKEHCSNCGKRTQEFEKRKIAAEKC